MPPRRYFLSSQCSCLDRVTWKCTTVAHTCRLGLPLEEHHVRLPKVKREKLENFTRRLHTSVEGQSVCRLPYARMYACVQAVLLAVVILIARPAWGGENEWRMSPKPVQASVFQARLTPTVNGSPIGGSSIAPTSVLNLHSNMARPLFNGLLASTTWIKGAFSTETEVTANQTISPGDDRSTRMMRLAVTGYSGLVRYGMMHRNTGQASDQKVEQDVREAWGEWNIGTMAIRSAVGQQWVNVRDDATADRVKQSYNRIDVSWRKAAWPHLAFSYARNAASKTMDPAESQSSHR
jgi:hypothetical protein